MIRFDDADPIKAAANRKNHEGVTFEEGTTVLYDAAAITVTDYESDPDEERLVTIGMSAKGRVLVVVYTYRNDAIRLISARKATASERKEYSL
jgi:uncharacterized DUF497 family protein